MAAAVPATRVLALALALAIGVAACGGGSPASAPASPSTGATSALPSSEPSEAPSSTPMASPSQDPYAFAALFEGTYSGTWENTTYGSTGTAKLKIQLDRSSGALLMNLTLTGNVFGQPAPKPETIDAAITTDGLSFTSKTFGTTTVAVDLKGVSPVITMTSPNVPSELVKTFTATATIRDVSTIDFAYTVTFRTGLPTAKGVATLKR